MLFIGLVVCFLIIHGILGRKKMPEGESSSDAIFSDSSYYGFIPSERDNGNYDDVVGTGHYAEGDGYESFAEHLPTDCNCTLPACCTAAKVATVAPAATPAAATTVPKTTATGTGAIAAIAAAVTATKAAVIPPAVPAAVVPKVAAPVAPAAAVVSKVAAPAAPAVVPKVSVGSSILNAAACTSYSVFTNILNSLALDQATLKTVNAALGKKFSQCV